MGFLPNNTTGFKSASGFRRQTGQVQGCTNPNAMNFNANANYDDGSCIFPEVDYGIGGSSEGASSSGGNYIGGCLNTMGVNYNPNANYDDGSCVFVGGCTDPLADNYDPSAQFDDGSCVIMDYGIAYPSTGTNVGNLLDQLADAAGGPTGGASSGSSGGMLTDSGASFAKDPKAKKSKRAKQRFSGFAGRDAEGFFKGAPTSQPYVASAASFASACGCGA
tara:strand:+ start:623 stop:1282 length:660 start_codon:yes stop_codon:yes gene_type:complete